MSDHDDLSAIHLLLRSDRLGSETLDSFYPASFYGVTAWE